MTQISRPFQIALAAIALLVAVWFVALRGHSSGSESSGSAASSSAQPATPQQASGSSSGSGSGGSSGSASSPSSTYHGSAPGVAGLTRAIAKARGAVAQSEQSARQSQQRSEKASSSGSTQPGQTSSTSASHAGSSTNSQRSATTSPAKAAPHGAVKTKPGASGAGTHAKSGVPAMQLQVEGQLKHGRTVAILFWNPKGSVDAVVHRELQAAASKFAGKLAVHTARSSQVGSFGTFTRAVQVYSTPTILLINTKGLISSVTGLTDVFSIEQAVGEVKQAH